ncbi:hypothetical protein LCGC14_0397590 [marine sediment metagenome]|uniref:Uncharacterized protein n=1 Tax=marine sediment metagenome TaxID=412755 RepID=A0A0F9SY29_9ZZZZ
MNHQEALDAADEKLFRHHVFCDETAEMAVRAYLEARADEPGKIRYIDDPYEQMSPSAAKHLLQDFEVRSEK